MTEIRFENRNTLNRGKKILLGQLGKYGDCLYATTIARQIKKDYPDCHLTWAIGSIYRSILICNPYIDHIWEFPLSSHIDMAESWQEFEDQAIERKKKGDFDEIFLTQIYPNNYKNFDGTVRSSIFRGYNKPITVPVSPVLRLLPKEVENVKIYADSHKLEGKKHVILFEASNDSGQSFVTFDFAQEVSKKLIEKIPNLCIIISSNKPFKSDDERIIDGSVVSFRENAELTKYCTLLIGCSSGISWLSTSDWAKPLPMVQLLKKNTGAYASFVQDYKYHGINFDSIIEMTECTPDKLCHCITVILTNDFNIAKEKYHKKIRMNFIFYGYTIAKTLLIKGKFKDAFLSIRYTSKRWIFDVLFR